MKALFMKHIKLNEIFPMKITEKHAEILE